MENRILFYTLTKNNKHNEINVLLKVFSFRKITSEYECSLKKKEFIMKTCFLSTVKHGCCVAWQTTPIPIEHIMTCSIWPLLLILLFFTVISTQHLWFKKHIQVLLQWSVQSRSYRLYQYKESQSTNCKQKSPFTVRDIRSLSLSSQTFLSWRNYYMHFSKRLCWT